MAVRAGRLLDAVISQTKAKLFICIGWSYSVLIAILRSTRDNFDYTKSSLSHKMEGRVIWAISTLILIILIAMLQVSTYVRLRKRISIAVGSVNATQGLNILYKRAMKKSTLIAVCFVLGWTPLCILFVVQEFIITKYGALQRRLTAVFLALSLLQGFSNAIIFRAKHLLSHIKQCCKCSE